VSVSVTAAVANSPESSSASPGAISRNEMPKHRRKRIAGVT
jgi:hypothetical protein